ncbi:trafficking protein particle complex subunit 2-like protein [Centruroides sculpturatus]|uniref:trafficking protein particle complex subunit 2-like protein n=1 Tax=Centruroides sculpturatus TaxID=218467 RepID=UPI000C6DC8C7|nr:trafficking protein particle complex subunit 2-like protein [Centruroides sculpturatus]
MGSKKHKKHHRSEKKEAIYEDFSYGYVTNTKIKFVIIIESSHITLRDNEIRQMFRRLHGAYTDMVCNPFYIPGTSITSTSFENIVKSIMNQD